MSATRSCWGSSRRSLSPSRSPSSWVRHRPPKTAPPRGDVPPVAAVEAAREAGLSGHVFNSVRFGGYLMLVAIPTFVDGRADLYGDAFLQRYVAASSAVGGGG